MCSGFHDKEYSTPVDKALLNQDHLNAWRDLRTIEEVAMNRKDSFVFKKKVADFVEDLAKKNPSLNDQDWLSSEAIWLWTLNRQNKSLCTLLYYMKQTLKLHLPQHTHQEIDEMAEEIVKNFKFSSQIKDHPVRERIGPFLDSVMTQSGFYLLMQNLKMEKDLNLQMGTHSLWVKVDPWKGIIGTEDQIDYGKSYRQYMSLIEVFDILAAAGLQDKGAILKLTPRSVDLRLARKILAEHAPKARDLHYYLVNDVPYNPPKKLNLPIFGYPFELNGQDSNQVEDQVHKLWSKFEKEDLKIVLKLENPVKTMQKGDVMFPRNFKRMTQFKSLWKMKDKSKYRYLWGTITRSIGIVLKLDKINSGAHVVFWNIMYSAFKYLPKEEIDPKKVEVQIENSVMFYLLIRRMGIVLAEVFKLHSTTSAPEQEVNKEQCIMYYWSLFNYAPPNGTYKHKDKVKWMKFGIGRVYINHLLASMKLNELFQKTSTTQEEIVSHESSSSTFSENLGQSSIVDSSGDIDSMEQVIVNENPIDNPKFSKSRSLERKTKLKRLEEALNQIQATHRAPDVSPPKRKVSMHDIALEPKFFASIPKKPRTQQIEYNPHIREEIELLNRKLALREPNLDRTQSTVYNQVNLKQKNQNPDPSYQSMGDLKGPEPPSVEDRGSFMLSDLNEPLEPDYM
ncbi:uncharacterized protein MELLADRAFT_111846 [Melampsora larici-populina 98AG31]|uniref:Uncharacterized protein n=1 Tax=Melampsora larici-populina (strain 98AG31 / pathotype 3-4-7) TaxID=747676 RepID=F4S4J1_MELLP|nr:uncharacterized protein MELLADRAFT_111846 [Melampsora larici-populina 98AG31]EGG00419.1 hypothetical protein MELLADRAFT_111846 [Melampsora larici-populina 98AG31]